MTLTVEQIFTEARSQNGYLDEPVSDEMLHRLYATLKWGPTSANSSPARFAFVRSPGAKQRLIDCVSPGNTEKVRQAPVSVIIGMDMRFFDQLPELFPHADARSWFVDQPTLVESTAFRNSSLQGAYLIIAARALGLDCGPMSGFDANQVDEAFWSNSTVKTNFICTLGKGDQAKVFPRNPRLPFDRACRML
ncbi:malonic semialdehyde reductase [Variovorax humicola]|uniref:Putative NADH dehydrogenase/NAD(P)H nitroreductase WKW80_32085 n=1 Tax=Variovorax humicola TaxID=1769758 RepID=A0ABU8W9J3_9BURK